MNKPARRIIIMFIHHRYSQLVCQRPALFIVCPFAKGAGRPYYHNIRIFFFDSLINHRETFFKNITYHILITHSEVFQIKRFRMSGFCPFPSPHRFLRVAIGIFYQIQNILNILSHLFHRNTALLTVTGNDICRMMARPPYP